MKKMLRIAAISASVLTLSACGFQLRGEAKLPADLQRVHVAVSDAFSPLKRDIEAALARSGATVESAPGEHVAEITLSAVALAPVVRSVGANATVNEFSMVYHVELGIQGSDGKTLLTPQVIEHSRAYTFDQTQAIGSNAEQDEIKKSMERDMVDAIMRKIDAVARGH
ncbi:MAG TPA: LPS assembly lipoprotein LptE [Rudaea sp.]|jgi:LPS-assembly lipoprotein|nr:LPS assembly lipoprotein LptE [Rudaea sp.]